MNTSQLIICTCVLLLSALTVGAVYYGKEISSDWGTGAHEGLRGTVHAVADELLQITDFALDEQAGNAVFHVGTDKSYSDAVSLDGADSTAEVLTSPSGDGEAIGVYKDDKVLLSLKGQTTLSAAKYIAIFSKDSNEYIGGMDIPSDFDVPAPVSLGAVSGHEYEVSSGDVTVLDDKTIQIKAFNYNGKGPDAFFYIGVTDKVEAQTTPYGKISDETGNLDTKLGAYSGEDITLTLPDGISATQLKWLSVYCIEYSVNFGEVRFDSVSPLNVPPYTEISVEDGDNQAVRGGDNGDDNGSSAHLTVSVFVVLLSALVFWS